MTAKGYSLKGTSARALDISTAIRFEAAVDRTLIELLRDKLSAEVVAEAEREAAALVLSSGLFEVTPMSANQ